MSLRVFRNRPAVSRSKNEGKSAAAAPEEWDTKEVTRFLEKQGLNDYASAAKKAKIRGSHLLNAAALPFFIPATHPAPLSASAPLRAGGEQPVLRSSGLSPNFGTLTRSKSFMFGPSRSSSSSSSLVGNSHSEALAQLCDQLGILSVVDRRKLWLALLMLHRQQADSTESANAAGISKSEKTITTKGARPRPASTYMPLCVSPKTKEAKEEKKKRRKRKKELKTSAEPVSSEEKVPGECKRSSSFSAVPLDTNSESFFAEELTSPTSTPFPIALSLPLRSASAIAGQLSLPTSPAGRKRADAIVPSPKPDADGPATATAATSPKGATSTESPSRKRRAAIGPKVATLRKWVMPFSPQSTSLPAFPTAAPAPSPVAEAPTVASPPRSPPRSPSPSKVRKRKASLQGGNPGLSYAESHGVVMVKCCLLASALMDYDCAPTKEYDTVYDKTEQDESGEEDQQKKTSKKRKEEYYYDDISMLRLDAKKVLFTDLMSEIQRLHGPLLMSLVGKDGEHGIKVSYKDAEGDVVNVQSDDSLRYALEDWQKAALTNRRQNGRSTFIRLVVEVEQGTGSVMHVRPHEKKNYFF